MTDNDVIQLFLPIIQAGLIADGFVNTPIKQAYQPTQQGINTVPTVYFYKVENRRYGWLGRFYNWDEDTDTMVHTEKQYIESTFQIFALVQQFPITPNRFTASDLVNEVAAIMQSDSTIDTLNASGVGILRINEIRNPYFVDDKDQFEASPSFDFTLTYQNTRVSNAAIITPPVALDIRGI